MTPFRDAFCLAYRCRPEKFERKVLRRCFPPIVAPVGILLLALRPRIFERELSLLARVGQAPGDGPLESELDGYIYENQRDRPFRVVYLGLRLSRRRFYRLYRRTMGAPAGGTGPAERE